MSRRALALSRFKIDPGIIVVLAVATYAAWPFLTRPSLPTFTDGEQHVYRTIEIMSAWQAGVFYARWAPDVYHGFGSPVFNFYSPLTYYLAAAYGWVWGGPVAGVKFVMVFSAYLGAVGMYGFGRSLWGTPAGLVSATVFSLSPYIVYLDPVSRGDAPEALALAIVPWMLWAFTRVFRTGGVLNQGLAAVALASLIFSHNLIAILFFGWLLIWLLALWVETRGSRASELPLRAAWHVLVAIVLGLGLAACLWLPAVVERNAVRLNDATVGYLDFRRMFVPLAVLLRPATVNYPDWQMGAPQWGLAAMGVLSPFFVRARRSWVVFLVLAEVSTVALTLPVTRPLWERWPLMAFLQFPWRLLGPAAVTTALLAGAAARWSTGWRWPAGWWQSTPLFVVVAVAACVLAIFPVLDPLPWADFGEASVLRLLKSGVDWWPGTTASNEFLPVTVKSLPLPQPALLSSYETGQVDKVNRSRLPPEAQATMLEHTPVEDRLHITSPAMFTLCLYTFYFPGWTAYVDGTKTAIAPSQSEGWITLDIPAGEHEVRLRFEDTWPRQLGWGLSACAALGLAGLLVRRREPWVSYERTSNGVSARLAFLLGGMVVVGLGLRYAADQHSGWRVKPDQVEKPAAQHEVWVPLESNVALMAYDLPLISVQPGDHFSVTLYWEAFAPVTRNLRVFVHLIGSDGKLWGQSDHLRPGGFEALPTSRWPVYRYVRDAHDVVLDPSAPAGTYTLRAGLWDGLTSERMHVVDADGATTDQDGIVLTTHFVVQP